MAVSRESVTSTYIVSKDLMISRTLARLLELDDRIDVIGEAASIGTAAIAEQRPGAVLYDEAGQAVDPEEARRYLDRVAPQTRLMLLGELRALTLGEILDRVRALATPSAFTNPRHLHAVTSADRQAFASLSDREVEVVRLVAEGLSNKEISQRLSLSDKTVKNHISHILSKMNLTARTQVAVCALRAGLV